MNILRTNLFYKEIRQLTQFTVVLFLSSVQINHDMLEFSIYELYFSYIIFFL